MVMLRAFYFVTTGGVVHGLEARVKDLGFRVGYRV